jgi:hypothetical protein
MADLASTDVTVIRNMTEHSGYGRWYNKYYCKMVLAGQGDNTTGKKVPASAFGMQRIIEPFVIVDSTGVKSYMVHPVPADVDTYGEETIILDTYHATGAKVNLTGTYYGVVTGLG